METIISGLISMRLSDGFTPHPDIGAMTVDMGGKRMEQIAVGWLTLPVNSDGLMYLLTDYDHERQTLKGYTDIKFFINQFPFACASFRHKRGDFYGEGTICVGDEIVIRGLLGKVRSGSIFVTDRKLISECMKAIAMHCKSAGLLSDGIKALFS